MKATTTLLTNPNSNLTTQLVTEALEKPTVTDNTETAGPKKTEPKSTAAPKWVFGKSKKKAATGVKTVASTPATSSLVVATQSPTSPLEEISDFLNYLPSLHVWS